MRALIRDVQPDVVLDVGANVGGFAATIRRLGYVGPIISFEPSPGVAAALEQRAADDPLWKVLRLALGDRDEVRELRLADDPLHNSFLDYLRDVRVHGTEPVEVARLDKIMDDAAMHARAAVLKIDTQGWDMRVLAGAEGVLDRIVVVQVELAFQPLYEGETGDWLAMVGWLRDREFELVSLFPNHWKDGVLAEADGLFRRKASSSG